MTATLFSSVSSEKQRNRVDTIDSSGRWVAQTRDLVNESISMRSHWNKQQRNEWKQTIYQKFLPIIQTGRLSEEEVFGNLANRILGWSLGIVSRLLDLEWNRSSDKEDEKDTDGVHEVLLSHIYGNKLQESILLVLLEEHRQDIKAHSINKQSEDARKNLWKDSLLSTVKSEKHRVLEYLDMDHML